MFTLAEIGARLRTQDNRITQDPIFLVERKVRDYGYDSEYADEYHWVDFDGDWVVADEDESDRLDEVAEAGDSTGRWEKIYYKERWEFVQPFLTEVAAQHYIDQNSHNLGETRIWGASGHRNWELIELRKFLSHYDVKPLNDAEVRCIRRCEAKGDSFADICDRNSTIPSEIIQAVIDRRIYAEVH